VWATTVRTEQILSMASFMAPVRGQWDECILDPDELEITGAPDHLSTELKEAAGKYLSPTPPPALAELGFTSSRQVLEAFGIEDGDGNR